jgi:hypothetical protein
VAYTPLARAWITGSPVRALEVFESCVAALLKLSFVVLLPRSAWGQKRRFERALATSALTLSRHTLALQQT